MAKGDRRTDFLRLFSRSKRSKHPSKPKVAHGRRGGRVTDALGATRAMQPSVVHPEGAGAEAQRPELTIVHPPAAARRAEEPHLQVREHRVRFSLSFLACGTLAVAFVLLLLVSFVVGTKYQASRSRSATVARHEPGPGEPPGGDKPRDRGENLPLVGIRGRGGRSGPPAATKRYRLRIAIYAPSKRAMAEGSVATLREKGVDAVLSSRRIDGRERLVIYSRQHFDSPSSPEAVALQRTVQTIKQNGRYDFTSAYLVEER